MCIVAFQIIVCWLLHIAGSVYMLYKVINIVYEK